MSCLIVELGATTSIIEIVTFGFLSVMFSCANVGAPLLASSGVYTAVMSFEILFPFGLLVFEPDWLFNHSHGPASVRRER